MCISGIVPRYPKSFKYLCLDLLDVPGQTVDFDTVTDFVVNALNESPTNKVFIHWYASLLYMVFLGGGTEKQDRVRGWFCGKCLWPVACGLAVAGSVRAELTLAYRGCLFGC